MMLNMVVYHRHLASANTRTDVRHAIVISYLLVLIVGVALTILRSIHHDFAPWVFIRRNQCSTTRSSNHLITIKRQHAILTESTKHLTIKPRTKSFGSILNHRNLVLIRNLHDTVNPVWHTIQCHRHNSLWLLACLSDSVLDSLFQQFRIHIPSVLLGIHEHRCRSKVCNRMARSTECEALHNHLIPRLHSACNQRQMYRCCTCTQRNDSLVLPTKVFQTLFKCIHIWTKRDNPIGIKGFFYVLLFQSFIAHVSQAQINSLSFWHNICFY